MTDDKTPATKAAAPRARKKPAPKSKSDWTALVTKPESAPKITDDAPEPAAAPAAAPGGNVVVTEVHQLVRPKVKAATFRLPDDARQAIDDAIAEAAARGDRLTKDAAVTDAIRTWAKVRARRKS